MYQELDSAQRVVDSFLVSPAMYKDNLLEKIRTRTAQVAIIGLGYVGLPLAVAFAEAGVRVIGIDLDAEKVSSINSGRSYIPDIPTAQLSPLVESHKLRASSKFSDLDGVDIVSICVPTPLKTTKDPDLSYVIGATDAIAAVSRPGMLIVLESTTYPGTTEEVVVPRLIEQGLIPGENVFVGFSPERIDPGNERYSVRNTPKVVGGYTAACLEVGAAYYGSIVERVVPVSSVTAAEMVKLLENTFRSVNIGLVNELAIMCDRLKVDVWEVIEAAASKPFGYMAFQPGPGIGGHCIPIDPLYLSWKLKTLNYTARFIDLASEVNTSMPHYVVQKVVDALNDDCKSLHGADVAIIGVAYKRDINDVRESPALDVIELLRAKGANVTYHDPYVPFVSLHDKRTLLQNQELTEEWLSSADCVVIITDHKALDWNTVLKNSKVVVDTRNITAKLAKQGQMSQARIVKILARRTAL